jgi:hypothetical protein
MPYLLTPDDPDNESYRGLAAIYQYINSDGKHFQHNCGQAAACTFLTHYRALPPAPPPDSSHSLLSLIESRHPSDIVGGWFGTSQRRVVRICREAGVPVELVHGEEELRQSLANFQPVMVMLQSRMQKKVLGLWRPITGHWQVAYGYDERKIYLTNNADVGMPWEEFRRDWNGLIPRLISMRRAGLRAITQLAHEQSYNHPSATV